MGEESGDHETPLLHSDFSPKRTGTLWSYTAHIITAVIGSGVLSFAWSVAQLGWIAGPASVICFAIITYVSSSLLADCYRKNSNIVLWFASKSALLWAGVAYVITTSTSMREGHEAPCSYGETIYMLIFGLVQILISQTPDFHSMEWLSIVASIMSFAHCFIGFGLSFAEVIAENGRTKGSITGVPEASIADKLCLWKPCARKSLDRIRVLRALLTLPMLALFFIWWEHIRVKVYTQPVFAFGETWFTKKFPTSRFVNNFYTFKNIPPLPPLKINLLRVCFRTAYVASTTAVAMIFPYFNDVLGVLGALNFWPLAIYFPVEMYMVQNKIENWTRK
ncbi:hypothetical protein EZV62_009319 [Acer yangbiense]|uniref:Amino acid transporter transmembrane domain-containing protein n=1 Tax=Acer yangbiense TaxID=1000413 RepID=A0A5C7IGC9_9ROSI|nr:hypothetical protein EZV62_009319 [Acer yangbiense]